MEKICKNCKWWSFPKDKDAAENSLIHDGEDYPSNEKVEELNGYGIKYCQSPSVLFYEKPNKNQAVIMDGSQYYGALLTGEEFGCNKFEPISD